MGPNFSKILLRQSLDFMVSYYNVQYQNKLMIQFLEKLATDARTYIRTDRLTDRKSDRKTDGRE